MSCCVHQLKHCNCGASGARHAEPILLRTEIYMNLYGLITVVSKIIVFLNNCISYLRRVK